MAKRFIDTNLFSDEWFCDLSKDCKLFFIYYITQCDHAGVLRLNKKLCKFQTDIKDLDTVIKEFCNCIVTVKEGVYFMPKYLKFQYPNFPQSNVKQQDGAIKILKELNLWDNNLNSYLTVTKELSNSYDNDNDNDNDNELKKSENIFFENIKLNQTFLSFIEMRKKIKKPPTKHAIDLLIKKLNNLSNNIEVQIKIIEQSIINSWQDLFNLRIEKEADNFNYSIENQINLLKIEGEKYPELYKKEILEYEKFLNGIKKTKNLKNLKMFTLQNYLHLRVNLKISYQIIRNNLLKMDDKTYINNCETILETLQEWCLREFKK